MIYGEISDIYGDIVLRIINNGQSAAKVLYSIKLIYRTKFKDYPFMGVGSQAIGDPKK